MYQNIATKVLTGEVRISYEHLSKPYANPNQAGAEPKYSVTLLIPKTDAATKADIDASLDLLKKDEVDDELTVYIEEMIEKRKEAKKNKDYESADNIRNELLEKGIELKDTREGTTWSKI